MDSHALSGLDVDILTVIQIIKDNEDMVRVVIITIARIKEKVLVTSIDHHLDNNHIIMQQLAAHIQNNNDMPHRQSTQMNMTMTHQPHPQIRVRCQICVAKLVT